MSLHVSLVTCGFELSPCGSKSGTFNQIVVICFHKSALALSEMNNEHLMEKHNFYLSH